MSSAAPPGRSGAPIETLLRDHRDELLAFACARTACAADAEDVVQQVAVNAVKSASALRDRAAGRAWLFRIARNVLADRRRRARPVEVEATDTLPDASSEAAAEPTCPCVLARARELKPEYAELLERVVVDELPIASAAESLDITPNNAAVRLHRARAALRRRLAEHCGTESLRACLDCGCDDHRSRSGDPRET